MTNTGQTTMRLVLDSFEQRQVKRFAVAIAIAALAIGSYKYAIYTVYGSLQKKYIVFDKEVKSVNFEIDGVNYSGPPPEESVILESAGEVFTLCFASTDGIPKSITFKTQFTVEESTPTIFISPSLVQYQGIEVLSTSPGLLARRY